MQGLTPSAFCHDDVEFALGFDAGLDTDISPETDFDWKTFTIKIEVCMTVTAWGYYKGYCEVVTEWKTAEDCVVASTSRDESIDKDIDEELYKDCMGIELTFEGLSEFIEGMKKTAKTVAKLIGLLKDAYDFGKALADIIEQITDALLFAQNCKGDCPPGSGPPSEGDD